MCAAAKVSERVYFFVVCRRELRAGEAWLVAQEVRELGSSDELKGEIFTRAYSQDTIKNPLTAELRGLV